MSILTPMATATTCTNLCMELIYVYIHSYILVTSLVLLNFHPKNQKSVNEKKMLGIIVIYVSVSRLEMLSCRKCIKDFKERSDRV